MNKLILQRLRLLRETAAEKGCKFTKDDQWVAVMFANGSHTQVPTDLYEDVIGLIIDIGITEFHHELNRVFEALEVVPQGEDK